MKISKAMKVAAATFAVAIFAAQPATAAVSLTGAGSTFAGPLIESCKAAYFAATGNTFTYGLGGSGAGRTASDKKTSLVNFSDTPHLAARDGVIHIPLLAGPIAVMYKLNTTKVLNLSADTVAGIFGGTITMWNDPAIVADNNRSIKVVVYKKDKNGVVVKDKNGVPIVLSTRTIKSYFTLPAKKIQVVYRADSSGTSGAFTAALHGAAPKVWPKAGNNDFKASFPGDINAISNIGRIVSASGSDKVVPLAAKTLYSITYAEKGWAKSNGLGVANIQNAAGNFQAPDSGGTSAFLGDATVSDTGILTYNYTTTNPGAYLFGTASYALVDTKYADASTATAVKSFLTYLLDPKCPGTDPSLEYTTITGSLHDIDLKLIAKIGS